MKLSEAMLLGCIHAGKTLDNSTWDTCLLGVSCHAVGTSEIATFYEANRRWPWLMDCFPAEPPEVGILPAYLTITSLCSDLIHGKKTIEQVVDWVRSVEPEEPTPATPIKEEVREPETCLM